MKRHIHTLLLGSGTAQALQFLSILLLSRIYLPSDFGLLARVQSIAMLLAIIATLQLHLTIPLSKSAAEAKVRADNVQAICLLGFTILFIPALLFGKVTAFALVLALFLGLTNTYNSYLVFDGRFSKISGFYVLRAIVIITLQVVLALLGVNYGLIFGALIAEALSALYLRLTQLGAFQRFNKTQIRTSIEMAASMKSFSLYGTLQELISVSAFYAPLLLFSRNFDESTSGQYAMASRLIWAPVVMLSGSIGQVLYHRLGKPDLTVNMDVVRDIAPRKEIIIAIFFFCALSFYLQDTFLYFLGPRWSLASQLLPLQLLWGAFFLLSTPFRVICRVLHLQKYQLTVDAGMLASFCLLFALSSFTPLHTMWCVVLIALGQNVTLGIIATRKVISLQKRNYQ
jgi:O-antigen/teichoic acid export membrane protein